MEQYEGLSINAVIVFQRICVEDVVRYDGAPVPVSKVREIVKMSVEKTDRAVAELVRAGWCERSGTRREGIRLTCAGRQHPFRRMCYRSHRNLLRNSRKAAGRME